MSNNYGESIVTPATDPAVTVEEAKKQLELVGTSHHDTFLATLIDAASEKFRKETQFQFGSQVEQHIAPAFPYADSPLVLPIYPVQSIDSISYLDEDDNVQTLDPAEYRAILNYTPVKIEPVVEWPTAASRLDAITVTYTTGHALITDYPDSAKQAILVLVSIMFAERTGEVPTTGIAYGGNLTPLYESLRDGFKYGDDFFIFGG